MCIKEIINALKKISKNMQLGKDGNDIELSALIRELRDDVEKEGTVAAAQKVTSVMCEILNQIGKDKNLLKYFYEKHSFTDFARELVVLKLPNEEIILIAEQLEYFINNSSREDIDMVLSVACSVNRMCKELIRRQLKIKFYDNLKDLNSSTIYFVLLSGSIDRIDERVMERLYELCSDKKNAMDESAIMNNPVYAILKLYQLRYIRTMDRFEEVLKDNGLFRMLCNTEYFEGEEFNPEWWDLLRDSDLQEKLAQDVLRARKINRKLEEYGQYHAIRSRAFWDIIEGIDAFSMQAMR